MFRQQSEALSLIPGEALRKNQKTDWFCPLLYMQFGNCMQVVSGYFVEIPIFQYAPKSVPMHRSFCICFISASATSIEM